MDYQEKPGFEQVNHEGAIKQRDEKLEALKKETELDPSKKWESLTVAGSLIVEVSKQASIEADTLIRDIFSNIEAFRTGPKMLQDHGDITMNPRIHSFAMMAIFQGVRDQEGLKTRIILQRTVNICEDSMEALDYDPDKPGYDEIFQKYDQADKALKVVDVLKPLGQ